MQVWRPGDGERGFAQAASMRHRPPAGARAAPPSIVTVEFIESIIGAPPSGLVRTKVMIADAAR